MEVVDLFPHFFRDKDRYPYMAATGEVTQLVLSMYYSEIAEAVKNLYNLDGSYYVDNLSQLTWKGNYARENIDELIREFFPYAASFLNKSTYADKRGLLSFVDSFFSTKGTMDGLFSLFNFLNLPISVYTREKEHGSVNAFSSQGEVQLESISDEKCVTKEEEEKQETQIVYEYFPGEWEALVAGKSIIFPNKDGNMEYTAVIPSSYSGKPVDFSIDGYLRVEGGHSYSFIIGSDDGAYMEIGEDGSIGRCWVPAEAARSNAKHSSNSVPMTAKMFELADWSNPDSWRTPNGYNTTFGHAFCWGSNWITWKAEEDGYVPIRIRKQLDAGGAFAFKLIGGKTSDVQAAIKPECIIVKGGSEVSIPTTFNTVPKFPSWCFDGEENEWGTWVYPLNRVNGGDGRNAAGKILGMPQPSLVCDYFDKDTLLKRKAKRIDPAGFLNDYDIVISINLLDKKSILDIEKANEESWKYYNKSLQKRVEELVKEFTWICSDVIAYLFYAKQEVVRLEDTVSTELTYRFRERTTDSSVRRAMLTVCEAKDSQTVRRVKPPAGYSMTAGSTNSLLLSYLEEGDGFVEDSSGNRVATNFASQLSSDETAKWVGVSSIAGNEDNPTPEVSTDTQRLRVTIKPDVEGIFDATNNKPVVFAKGGVFVGKSSAWYETNTDVKEWVTKNMYRGGTEVNDEEVSLEKYSITTANVADSRVFVLPNNSLEPDTPVVFGGSQYQYPADVFVKDRLRVNLISFGLTVLPLNLILESGVDTGTVLVTMKGMTTGFTVSITDTSWLSQTTTGNTVSFTSTVNDTVGDRVTTAIIRDSNPESKASATVTISQRASDIIVNPKILSFSHEGGDNTVTILTSEAVGTNWTVTSNAEWLTADNTGKVSATEHTEKGERIGILTYTATTTGYKVEVKVYQAGIPYVTVYPSTASLDSGHDIIYY